MARSLSGAVEAINSSLSAVCLFEFFANLYYSLMACWLRAGRAEWRLSWYFLLRHHTSCFPFLSQKISWIAVLCPWTLRVKLFWSFIGKIFYLPLILCCTSAGGREAYQHDPWKQWGGARSICDCVTMRDKCFSLIRLLSELRTPQLITPLTIFCFSQYQKAQRSWVEEKMLCLIITRGQAFDAGTVKFVIC